MSTLGYVCDLRAAVGARPVNLIGVGAVITNPRGHVLLGRRAVQGSV
ncbi:hypothetical protein HNQ07_001715 [Deinococcus metalli]|uniref:Uncharacterized protein n=1 Tax=Deinococcus metalli TaxID=1141878 RepID=A0A7W8KEG6_9DEIO|nr:hypothetical protein [Deinococcus metalli]MBB5376258.1 hypothetical protein [Deinococcus metalli]